MEVQSKFLLYIIIYRSHAVYMCWWSCLLSWCDYDVYVWQELVDCLPKFAYPVNEDLVGYSLLVIFYTETHTCTHFSYWNTHKHTAIIGFISALVAVSSIKC